MGYMSLRGISEESDRAVHALCCASSLGVTLANHQFTPRFTKLSIGLTAAKCGKDDGALIRRIGHDANPLVLYRQFYTDIVETTISVKLIL